MYNVNVCLLTIIYHQTTYWLFCRELRSSTKKIFNNYHTARHSNSMRCKMRVKCTIACATLLDELHTRAHLCIYTINIYFESLIMMSISHWSKMFSLASSICSETSIDRIAHFMTLYVKEQIHYCTCFESAQGEA